jgi:hypothetical protein
MYVNIRPIVVLQRGPFPYIAGPGILMADRAIRFGWLQRAARILLYVAIVGGVVLIVFGVYLSVAQREIKAGVGLITAGAAAILSFGLGFGIVVMVHTHAELHRTRRALGALLAQQRANHEEQQAALTTIAENAQLSDAAKSLAHREMERETLRASIREDITREDWDAAYSLVAQMANQFGYREEAERFREEIDQSRRDALESKVNAMVQQFEELIAAFNWERARAEVKRLLTLFPQHERIAALPARLESSFNTRKEMLKKQLTEAAERKEVDRSLALVRELDAYLTPQEASSLTEIVRGVFRDKLDNLTVQFELSVREHKWLEAIDVGKQIIREYPNTRRAQELRDGVLESLAKHAGIPAEQALAL